MPVGDFPLSFASLAVIVPTLNEEEGIAPTISELKLAVKKAYILVVDGQSVDGTVGAARDFGAEILFQKGTGKGNAIYEGIKHLDDNIDYVGFIDADYTYPASNLKEMVKILDAEKNVGMVLGNRFSKIQGFESKKNHFYAGNRILAIAHTIINGVSLNDPLTGLRVIRYELLKKWIPKSGGFDIEIEVNCLVKKLGYDIIEIPIRYRHRLGKKKLGFKNGFEILNRIISESTM